MERFVSCTLQQQRSEASPSDKVVRGGKRAIHNNQGKDRKSDDDEEEDDFKQGGEGGNRSMHNGAAQPLFCQGSSKSYQHVVDWGGGGGR